MKQSLFICPRCRTNLDRTVSDRLTCPQDRLEFWNEEGVWRFLLPESEVHYKRFMNKYEVGPIKRNMTLLTRIITARCPSKT